MSLKHLYDSTDGLVLKSLQGAIALNPLLRLDASSKSVYLQSNSSNKRVGVIAGGGSGHEPAHAGYTGTGMLTASVAGDVFASPSAKQILATIKLAAFSGLDPTSKSALPRDVLVIINNYTGDLLNFGLAIEKARFAIPHVKIDSVVVADDVSLLDQGSATLVGPRGLAGNILVCKLLGALSETGTSLETIKAFGDIVVQNLSSVGVGLAPCHVPGRSTERSARLELNEYELGLGLHNEPGVAKRELQSAYNVLDEMVTMLLDVVHNRKENSSKSSGPKDEETILFINNLGGMSQLEMGAAVHDIVNILESKGYYRPQRIYCSSYMTSLNAPGFSISILNVSEIHRRLDTLSGINVYTLVDSNTDALAWIGARSWQSQSHAEAETQSNAEVLSAKEEPKPSTLDHVHRPHAPLISASILRNAIHGACIRVLEIEAELTQYDTIAGDGDCGETFAAGANAIIRAIDSGSLDTQNINIATVVFDVADLLEDVMGGTIGALFAIFLNALASSLSDLNGTIANSTLTPAVKWARATQTAVTALERYTPAREGDRTIMDALHPFCAALQITGPADSQPSFAEAVHAAKRGAEATRGMKARLGRATYLSTEEELPPDPGAWGVCAVVDGMLKGLVESL